MEDKEYTKLENFFKKYRLLDFKKNETILRRDDNATHVFFIKKGFVRLHTYSEEGKEFTAIIFIPREIFPPLVTSQEFTNSYWYESITPVQAYKAPKDEFREFIRSDIDVYELLMQQLLLQRNALIYRMQHIILGKAKTTVAAIILIHAKLLGIKKNNNEVYLRMPITHQQISFSAGITRETTSLEIKKLEKSGIIKYKGRKMIVKDMDKLAQESYV